MVGPQGQMSPRADDPVRAPQPTVLELARARYRAATRNKTRPPPICTDSKPRPPSSPRASLLLVTGAKPRRSPRDALFPSRNETSPRPASATFLATAADDKGTRSSGGPWRGRLVRCRRWASAALIAPTWNPPPHTNVSPRRRPPVRLLVITTSDLDAQEMASERERAMQTPEVEAQVGAMGDYGRHTVKRLKPAAMDEAPREAMGEALDEAQGEATDETVAVDQAQGEAADETADEAPAEATGTPRAAAGPSRLPGGGAGAAALDSGAQASGGMSGARDRVRDEAVRGHEAATPAPRNATRQLVD